MSDREKIFISKLSIPGKANDELSYVFTDRAEHEAQGDGPVLFGIFHLFETAPIYHSLIKETVKNFVDFFHRSQASLTDGLQTEFDSSEFLFENAIQYTNERVTQFLLAQQEAQPRGAACDIRKVHFTIAALFSDLLFLSSTGSQISPMYVYPVFRKEGFSHYAVITIGDEGKDDAVTGRLFSNILSGKLAIKGSTFVMCNRHFLDYISVDQIKQAVTNMSIQNVSGYFEGLLGKVHGKHDFSAIFINPHYTGPLPKNEIHNRGAATNRSMAGLNSTASGTRTILSPSSLAPLKPILISALLAFSKLSRMAFSAVRTGAGMLFSLVATAIKERKFNAKDLRNCVVPLQHALVRAAQSVISFFGDVLRPESRTIAVQKIMLAVRHQLARVSELNRASKAILALGVIFAVLFFQSVISIKAQRSAERDMLTYQDALRAIELKVDLAEASLLYENGEKAQSIITSADALLSELPVGNRFPSDRSQKLSGRIELLKARLSRTVEVASPKVLASFGDQIPNASSTQLILVGATPVLFTADGVYRVDPKAGSVTLIDTQAKLPSIHCASALDEKQAYFCIGDANKLGRVNLKDGGVTTISADFSDAEASLQKIALYNKRLYVLDPSSNMIYRHEKKDVNFGKGTPWLKKQTSLATASAFSLDGTVFVLLAPTTVVQFAAGKEVPFPLPTLSPPLSAVTRIQTSDETPYLFLLEPTNNRIIVIDKKSKTLKYQLTSESFTELSDFAMVKKDLLVLNGTDLLRFPLP